MWKYVAQEAHLTARPHAFSPCIFIVTADAGKAVILHALCTDDKIFVCCENPIAARKVADELKKQLVLLQASSE